MPVPNKGRRNPVIEANKSHFFKLKFYSSYSCIFIDEMSINSIVMLLGFDTHWKELWTRGCSVMVR